MLYGTTVAAILIPIFIICIVVVVLICWFSKQKSIDVDVSGKRNIDETKLFALLKEQYSLKAIETKYNIPELLKEKKATEILIKIRGMRYQTQRTIVAIQVECSYEQLQHIYSLPVIDPRHERNKMTKALREKIKQRDNYTCQCCGKYMPDEVGLHIDHIIPVSKGGKTEEDNLQVLCSKCNLKKSNK